MAHILGLEHSLGGVLGQIGGAFGGLVTGGWPGALAGATVPLAGYGMGGNAGFDLPNNGGSPGFDEPIFNAGNGNGGAAMAGNGCLPGTTEIREVTVDKATGAIICMRPKKTRHRRRRLATNSDIADLTSLRAVLGPKLTMEWIATRGRR